MKKLLLIAVFAMFLHVNYATAYTNVKSKTIVETGELIFISENGDTTKPTHIEVRVEKEVENGAEKTRVWVNGKEVDENSEEFKKYSDNNGSQKIKVEKRKNKNGKKEKVIIIQKEVSEQVIISDDEAEEMDIKVDVTEMDGGKRKVIIRKKGKNGAEEIEEIIIDEKGDNDVKVIRLEGDNKVIIKTKEEMDVSVDNDNDVEVDVDVQTEKDGKHKVIITTKDKNGNENVEEIMIDETSLDEENYIESGNGEKKIIIRKSFDTDFDLDGVDPENIETIDVKKEDGVTKIIIKTKDGKTIEKVMNDEVIKKKKKKSKKG